LLCFKKVFSELKDMRDHLFQPSLFLLLQACTASTSVLTASSCPSKLSRFSKAGFGAKGGLEATEEEATEEAVEAAAATSFCSEFCRFILDGLMVS